VSTALSSSSQLVERVLTAVDEQRLPVRNGVLVLAVSGGADSLCLLHVFHSLSERLGCVLYVAHLNHMLRGDEATGDADHVRDLCTSLGLPCVVESRDVRAYRSARKCSLEEAAREVRYQFLADVSRQVGASAVATGHTRDDLAETVLLHAIRGAGVHGLRGLEPLSPLPCQGASANDPILLIRPLLRVTRTETRGYCLGVGMTPREDSSNASNEFARNRLRLELLPRARELNPRIDDALVRLAEAAREDDDFIDEVARVLWRRIATASRRRVRIDRSEFVAAAPAVQTRLVVEAVKHLTGSARDLSAEHVRRVRDTARDGAPPRIETQGGLCWSVNTEDLTVSVRSTYDASRPLVEGIPLAVPGTTSFPGWRVDVAPVDAVQRVLQGRFSAVVDAERLSQALWVRTRRPGDAFQPSGMLVEKKLQDFMVDEKVPAAVRDSVPLLVSGNQILWIVGWRLSEQARVREGSRRAWRITFVPVPATSARDVVKGT